VFPSPKILVNKIKRAQPLLAAPCETERNYFNLSERAKGQPKNNSYKNKKRPQKRMRALQTKTEPIQHLVSARRLAFWIELIDQAALT